MTVQVLSVLPNTDQMERVQEILDRELRDLHFDITTTEKKAKEKLRRKKYDLVVTSLDIPEDSKALPEEGHQLGLCLAQWMEDENMNIPIILFTVVDDTELDKTVNRMKKCELINEKLGWEEVFIKRVRQGLEDRIIPEQDWLNVDIRLNLDKKKAGCSFRGRVDGACYEEHQPLDIHPKNKKELRELTDKCNELEKEFSQSTGLETGNVSWKVTLQGIGVKLMECIFKENYEFNTLFWALVTKIGGLNNTNTVIRFIVEKEVHPIAWEAIYGPHELLKKDYWMLHAPIYRTVVGGFETWGNPLFHDQKTREGPLNILIIESPTKGWAYIREKETQIVVTQVELGELKNVKNECEFLKEYSDPAKYLGRVKIGKVAVIPNPGDPNPFVDQVRETLEPGNQVWNIVHYAGHSYFDPVTKKGYVFFPGGQDERGESLIEVVELEELSVWLRRAHPNLVFLSSCYSSAEGFVFALASQFIPAIVGFRWKVEDGMATEYTKLFYRALFGGETQSLEHVFLKARQDIKNKYEDNPIWASPVLVMQIPSK